MLNYSNCSNYTNYSKKDEIPIPDSHWGLFRNLEIRIIRNLQLL